MTLPYELYRLDDPKDAARFFQIVNDNYDNGDVLDVKVTETDEESWISVQKAGDEIS